MTVTQNSPLLKRPQMFLTCSSKRQEVLLTFHSKHLSELPFCFISIKNATILVAASPPLPPITSSATVAVVWLCHGNGLHYHQQVMTPLKNTEETHWSELPDPWKNSQNHLNNLNPPRPRGPILQGLCQKNSSPPTQETATMNTRCEATGVSEWEPKFLPPLSHEI